MTKLKKLDLWRCRLSDESGDFLTHMASLRELHLPSPTLTDNCLASVAHLSKLETLDVCPNPKITDAGVASLQALRNLHFLHLAGTCMTNKSNAVIASMTNLENLELRDCDVDDSIIEVLKNLKKLKHLNVRGTRVTSRGGDELKKALPDLDILY